MQTTETRKAHVFGEQQIASLEAKKIFFGHQSVGADVIQGIRDLMREDSHLRLNLITSTDPETISGPAFIDSPIGQNRNPDSKNRAFAAILGKGMGSAGGIAMYKYCYIDIDLNTDVRQLFEEYRDQINVLKAKYPSLVIVHITVPLMVDEPSLKNWMKTLIGRPTSRDVNAKRNQFNALLREHYVGDPIFDLAQVESTHLDGSRCFVTSRGQKVYTLAPEFTTDGGHLNQSGRRVAAQQLLQLLARLP